MTPQQKLLMRTKILEAIKDSNFSGEQKQFFINFCADRPQEALKLIEIVKSEK